MIESWIVKRTVQSTFARFNEDDFDVDAFLADYSEDAVYDLGSEVGVGETLKGKTALADWFKEYKREFPKRKFVVKNVCMKGSFLPSPSNVVTVEWSCVATNKEGKEFSWDGLSISHLKKGKIVHGSDHISCAGLPKLSNLIKPTVKA